MNINKTSASTKKKRIIIADDSNDIRSRIKNLIEAIPDIEVVGEADNGIDATDLINSKRPDYAILDINMPKTSGIHVLKSIKSFNDTNVIMLTNQSESIYKKTCLKLGATHFLDKTNDFYELNKIFA